MFTMPNKNAQSSNTVWVNKANAGFVPTRHSTATPCLCTATFPLSFGYARLLMQGVKGALPSKDYSKKTFFPETFYRGDLTKTMFPPAFFSSNSVYTSKLPTDTAGSGSTRLISFMLYPNPGPCRLDTSTHPAFRE